MSENANQLLEELKSLNDFLIRNIGVFDYNHYVLNPDNDSVELVITRKQLKLIQNSIGGWIHDIKEEDEEYDLKPINELSEEEVQEALKDIEKELNKRALDLKAKNEPI